MGEEGALSIRQTRGEEEGGQMGRGGGEVKKGDRE